MLTIENVTTFGFEEAIRGMRNPLNSWIRSDSGYCQDFLNRDDSTKICADCPRFTGDEKCDLAQYMLEHPEDTGYLIGPNDHILATKLAKGGPVHGKYRRMITVYADITAPLYWWKEYDTYKVGTVANSCSTMHKIAAKPFALSDFSHEKLTSDSEALLRMTIVMLNKYRNVYNNLNNQVIVYAEGDGPSLTKKDVWWQMIQLLPTSYNQRRTIMLNYEVLHNIYYSRRDHKLDEWHTFCDWIKELPYSDLILAGGK